MTSSAGDVPMRQCGYCGNYHNFSADIVRSFYPRPPREDVEEDKK
jgi:hypothetical protein